MKIFINSLHHNSKALFKNLLTLADDIKMLLKSERTAFNV